MIEVGAASIVINNELGTPIQGASVNQVVRAVRDDLEANALYFRRGDVRVLLVSCDVVGIEPDDAVRFREQVAQATGVPARAVIIAGTHTHGGPSMLPTNYVKSVDKAYHERLGAWLAKVCAEAVAAARPALVGTGIGTARVGYNRRVCWADGTHSMLGDTRRPEYTGLEGPVDPQHMAIFARDLEGKLIAVLHHNSSHPTAFYGGDVLSADYPGVARRLLREALGPIPVLFFNGAQGDISLEDQQADPRWRETIVQKITRAGSISAGETLRLLHEARFEAEPAFAHRQVDLEVPVRLPTPERVAEARALLARVDAGEKIDAWKIMFAHGPKLLQDRFGEHPVDTLSLHALRLGQLAVLTQPVELYCQFALDIKRRSPATQTAVLGIADGLHGYCPTLAGQMGGGYSGDAFYWSRLGPEVGQRIVDASAKLLHELWRG
ncbi:MAG: hypothetical protein NTW19_09795 [Planctomycetota bacterium]|nr:hypothetical protein [Planctomycetota bacterium]